VSRLSSLNAGACNRNDFFLFLGWAMAARKSNRNCMLSRLPRGASVDAGCRRTRLSNAMAPDRLAQDPGKALRLVLAYSWNPIAYQILNPGIQHWFSRTNDAVIGYATANRVRVVAGAPICPPTILLGVTQQFEAEAKALGERVCYFHVGPRFASVLSRSGEHSIACIGSLPYWNPADWHSILNADASLRYQLSRVKHKEVTVAELPASTAALSPELCAIRREWLDRKHLPPLHFLIEPEVFHHLAHRRLFVASRQGCMLAYLLCSPMPNRNGWLLEQWARVDDAPLGISELLVHEAMSTFADEGCQEVTMGLVPLSNQGLVPGDPGPLWLKLLFRFMRLTANPLYNFKGLEYYKYKLRPHYSEPVYAVVTGRRFSPLNVIAIARIFAGSPLELFAWRTLKRAFKSL
jgi:phosphatidylglycerol lysyltransferase